MNRYYICDLVAVRQWEGTFIMQSFYRKVRLDGSSPSQKRAPCEVVPSGHRMKTATDGGWKLVKGKHTSKRHQLKEKELADLSKIIVFGVHRDFRPLVC